MVGREDGGSGVWGSGGWGVGRMEGREDGGSGLIFPFIAYAAKFSDCNFLDKSS
jgi:hypothetical protein